MLVFILCLLTLAATGQAADPCQLAQLIDEPRRSTNYTSAYTDYNQLYCDNTLKVGWYRFNGGSKLATSCQPFYHCNTHVPVWMRGSHPTILGQPVSAEVCAPGQAGCAQDDCFTKNTIKVVMCPNFYAYELQPTQGCTMAYCAGDGTPCEAHQTSPTGFTPGCVDKYPLMLNGPHLSDPILTYVNSSTGKPTSFEFQCQINFDPARNDVGFDVKFLFDGKWDMKVPTRSISGAQQRTVSLDQKYLIGHMGQNVSCAVSSYFSAPGAIKGPFIPSNGYWAGIKVEQNRLEVGEKDKPRTLVMYSTVPVVCPPPHDVTCHLDIDLDPINNNNDIDFVKECRVTFYPGMWNSSTHRAETTFQVSATRDGKVDKDKEIYVHFKPIFTGDASPAFNNYQVPFVQIMAKNTNTATCWCTGDPHCKTLDMDPSKANVLDYYLIGDFVMYKSTNRNFEVQVRTWSCGAVSCNCAVAMKENNDVVILDMCDIKQYGKSYPKLTVPGKGLMSHGTVISQDRSGNDYLVSFPSGAQVRIHNVGGVALDVTITAPEDDFKGTEGICGYFDGNPANDLKHSDGKVSNIPNTRFQDNEFVNSWRIKPVGSSFFDKTPPPNPSLDHDMYFCKCDNKSKQIDCTLDGNVAKPNVQALLPGAAVTHQIQNGHLTIGQITAGRRRRAASSILPDDYPAGYVYDYGLTFVPVLKADFPSVHGKSRAEADAACSAAIDQNPTVQQCVQKTGLNFATQKENCVEDFKYFDDGAFVRSHMLNAITTCVDHVLKNESFYDANGNLPAFISTDLCPSYDCNKHGSCTRGRCVCDAGYIGDACEIQATRPPVLYGVVKTTWIEGSVLCDVTERECETAYVFGTNVFDNTRLSCRVEVLKFDGHSFVPTGSEFTTAAIYRSMYDVGCKLPMKSTIGGLTVVAFNISVTNDASTYSNEVTYVRTDGRCAKCVKTGESCSVKSRSCLIEGNCWSANETNPANPQQICDPTRNNIQWTSPVTNNPLTTESSYTVTTPPTAALGGASLSRFDIWTFSQSGCKCAHNPSDYSCACCDAGGCQCQAPHHNQCSQCGKSENCGSPQPAPENGVDGFTNVFDDCPCKYDPTKGSVCACCKEDVNACQCGPDHRNQCVDCSHMEQCGNKPWIFGPPFTRP
ncbi:von Willebrand factor D and EGF domain-containing protein-like [Dreissena polymorpha]|uniref:von Willebrand factor D and EGF domain-containing protein-like n=1 Tax=Dreissena polymorpha TaxID=45954 RepID=UPI0022641CD4|nr:von Willebrand factor D and EGF domain-containing protein-like [Dreissena polymorpha]